MLKRLACGETLAYFFTKSDLIFLVVIIALDIYIHMYVYNVHVNVYIISKEEKDVQKD
jgi:hypothetical protein